MSRYLVTGCAGFIASNVCRELLAAGHEVVGVDNLNAAYDPRLKEFRLAQLRSDERFRFAPLDVSNREATAVYESATSFDGVLHLAARAGVRASVDDPWSFYHSNVVGTLNMLEYCRRRGIGKIVVASSSSVYGDSQNIPYREDQPVDRPVSPYAASKQAAETLCHTYHRLHSLDVSLLRYFTVYGPAGRPDMSVFRFIRGIAEQTPITLFGDGSQQRDFSYVTDIARGTILALKPVGYEIFNLGGDEPHSVSEMLAILSRLLGQTPHIEQRPAHPADVPRTWADVSKARALLGWRPEVSFEQGLSASVAWYREHRELARSLSLGD